MSFRNIETIKADYQIVSPILIGNAKDNRSINISPQSFKGAMRFWWRAMSWGRFSQGLDNQPSDQQVLKALARLHAKEAELFGSSAEAYKDLNHSTAHSRGHYGQGCFSLKITVPKPEKGSPKRLGYLAYGAHDQSAPLVSLKENQHIGVDISIHSTNHRASSTELIDEIGTLLRFMGLMTNLGAKSRNGFGSIQLISMNGEPVKTNETIIRTTLDDIRKQSSALPPYSALSGQCLFGILNKLNDDSPTRLLQTFQQKYQNSLQGNDSHANSGNQALSLWAGLPRKVGAKRQSKKVSPSMYDQRRTKAMHFHMFKDDDSDQFKLIALSLPTSLFHHQWDDSLKTGGFKTDDFNRDVKTFFEQLNTPLI